MTAPVKNINEAFDSIGDENSNLSIQERFDFLGQEIISYSYFIMERQRQTKQRITEEESQLQEDMIDQFNIIEKIFVKLKKAGRLSNVTPNEKFGEQLLKRIQTKKSTIGEIVQSLPSNLKKS